MKTGSLTIRAYSTHEKDGSVTLLIFVLAIQCNYIVRFSKTPKKKTKLIQKLRKTEINKKKLGFKKVEGNLKF